MTDTFAPLLGETALGRRMARVLELAEAQDRLVAVAIVLETSATPDGMSRLDPGRVVALLGDLTDDEHAETLAALRRGVAPDPRVLVLELRAGMAAVAIAVVIDQLREAGVFGARGDGKTLGGAVDWLLYAWRHRALGGSLPVRVLVPTTAMAEHRDKLCVSLRESLWRGLWRSVDDEHLWIATIGGVQYVHLALFGVKDAGEQDKARQAAHAAWIEEAVPAGVEAASGLTEDLVGLLATSLRLPSYHHPIVVTSNYGSESHWTWQRYAVRQQPGSRLFRISPGEWATAKARAEWLEALDGRPDLQRRLVLGEPALIVQGEGVLHGVWNPEIHVSRQPLEPVRGARTMLGHDTGLRPATVVVQEVRGQLRVLATLTTAHGGMRQHMAGVVLPWLGRHRMLERVELEHRIDPAGMVGDFSNSDESPQAVIDHLLPGAVLEGPVKWPPRIEPLLAVLGRLVAGQPALIVSCGPDTAVLREAAAGKWFYPWRADGSIVRELPDKTYPHSDVGDALCYAIAGLAPNRMLDLEKPRPRLPRKYGRLLGEI